MVVGFLSRHQVRMNRKSEQGDKESWNRYLANVQYGRYRKRFVRLIPAYLP